MAKAASIKKVTPSTSKGKHFIPPATVKQSSVKPTKAPNSGKSFKAPGPVTSVKQVVKGSKRGK